MDPGAEAVARVTDIAATQLHSPSAKELAAGGRIVQFFDSTASAVVEKSFYGEDGVRLNSRRRSIVDFGTFIPASTKENRRSSCWKRRGHDRQHL